MDTLTVRETFGACISMQMFKVTLTSRDANDKEGVLRENIWTESNAITAKSLLVKFMKSLKHNELRLSDAGEFSVNALPKLQQTTISVH